jgi:hypothetical protein
MVTKIEKTDGQSQAPVSMGEGGLAGLRSRSHAACMAATLAPRDKLQPILVHANGRTEGMAGGNARRRPTVR